jgi:hypothetical protein
MIPPSAFMKINLMSWVIDFAARYPRPRDFAAPGESFAIVLMMI